MPTVLVTGSSRGIGRAIAEALRARRARAIHHAATADDGQTVTADFAEPMGPQLLWQEALGRTGGVIDAPPSMTGPVIDANGASYVR